MKITRKRIRLSKSETSTAHFYRRSDRGLLYAAPEKKDRTSEILNCIDFQNSWVDRLRKRTNRNPFDALIQSLVKTGQEIPLPAAQVCTPEMIDKHLTVFGQRLKTSNTEQSLSDLLQCIGKEEDNLICAKLHDIKKLIGINIEKQVKDLIHSIEHNCVPFQMVNGVIKPSGRKMIWLYGFLDKQLEKSMLDEYWKEYDLQALEGAIKGLDLENCRGREIAEKIYAEVLRHHSGLRCKAKKEKTQEEQTAFFLFLNEVRAQFHHYYPPRKKDTSLARDTAIESGKCYYNKQFVQDEVYRSLCNQLTAGLIQQGKLQHYVVDQPTTGTEPREKYFSSDTLSYIQIQEAFKKHFMAATSWAISKLNYLFGYSEKSANSEPYTQYEDILTVTAKNKLSDPTKAKLGIAVSPNTNANNSQSGNTGQNQTKVSYGEYFFTELFNKGENDIKKRLRNRITGCYATAISDDDLLARILWETKESVDHVRNHIFHYKKNSLLKLLDPVDKDLKETFIETPKLFEKDIERIQECFQAQIRSSGMTEYYPVDLLRNCLDPKHIQFHLYAPQYPFIPSFKKVFQKGANLYNSEENHMGLHWFQRADKTASKEAQLKMLAYRNLLKLLYYHAFLPAVYPAFSSNSSGIEGLNMGEGLITDYIEKTKDWNKAHSLKKGKVYRYEAMPDYQGEGLHQYLQNLQRRQVQQAIGVKDGSESKNYYLVFVQDLIVIAFDAYLDKLLGKYREELQNPEKQECGANKGLQALFEGFKLSMNSTITNNGTEMMEKLLPIYPFMRLLGDKELSSLRHQLIRYRCSLQEYELFRNWGQLEEETKFLQYLEELTVLAGYTIPDPTQESEQEYERILQERFSGFIEGDMKDYRHLFYQSDDKTPIPHKHIVQLIHAVPLCLYQDMFKDCYKISLKEYEEYCGLSGIGGEITSSEIERKQCRLAELHKELVKIEPSKIKPSKRQKAMFADLLKNVSEYEQLLEEVQKYNHLHKKLTFERLYEILQIHLEIMGRFVAYAADWERDMFFLLTALKSIGVIKFDVHNLFKGGCVVGKLKHTFEPPKGMNAPKGKKLFYRLLWHDRESEIKYKFNIRNRIAHLNHLNQVPPISPNNSGKKNTKVAAYKIHPSIETMVNQLRVLLTYDRKRQNAVTQSIIELLLKNHHLILSWKDASLNKNGSIKSEDLVHLKNLQWKVKRKVEKYKCSEEEIELLEKYFQGGVKIAAHDSEMINAVAMLLHFDYNKQTGANPKCP